MSDLPNGPLLNVGCGLACSPDWINIDGSWQAWLAGRPRLARLTARLTGREVGDWPRGIVCRDVRRGLGFPTASVAAVFCSHFLEHLYRDEALALLREAHRVLKPGGVCRVVVPDLAAIVGQYLELRAQPLASDRRPASETLMEMLGVHPAAAPSGRGLLRFYRRWTDFDAHKWMYDADGVLGLFHETAFSGAKPRSFLDSAIPGPALAAVERPDRVQHGAGVCVEARR